MATRIIVVLALAASSLALGTDPVVAAPSVAVTPDGHVTWDTVSPDAEAVVVRHREVAPIREALTPLIVGGRPAPIQEHRHMVRVLGFADGEPANVCGGALVASQWVLTAKHCWGGADSFTAVVGVTEWPDVERDPDRFAYASDTIVRAGFGVDLALIRLERPVPAHVGVPIAVHPSSDLPDGTPASIIGWGVADDGARPEALRRVATTIDAGCGDWASAGATFLEGGFDPDRTLCTTTAPMGACRGDSGGPVVVNDAGAPFLVGTVAFGSSAGCGADPDLPDGHVKVAAHRDWIESVTGSGWETATLAADATSFSIGALTPGSTVAVSLEVRRDSGSSFSMATITVPGPGLRTVAEIGVDCAEVQPHPFVDVPEASFASAPVGCLHRLGITTGTTATTFSPGEPVTRRQMAAFVSRFIETVTGAACLGTHVFVDVAPSSYAYEPVGCLFENGITDGAGDSRFAADEVVTREQMAAFVARTYRVVTGSACGEASPFADVPSTSFAYFDVGCLASLDITQGTSATTYSPAQAVTRAQMAAFVERLFNAVTDTA